MQIDFSEFDRLNVYLLWLKHRDDVDGLWVVRNSWGNMVAKIVECDELTGKPPYFSNGPEWEKPTVFAEFFYADGRWANNGPLLCPGTYAYRKVDKPTWA
jgi:hypothetical protein